MANKWATMRWGMVVLGALAVGRSAPGMAVDLSDDPGYAVVTGEAPFDAAVLESRIRALESRGSVPVPVPMEGDRTEGWSGGAEVMFFRPSATARTLPVQYVDDADYQPAWRGR